jgi:hypothetical protein
MDPLTTVLVGAAAATAGRVAVTHAETRRLRARAELARAVAALPPGTEITSTTPDGSRWDIRVPAAPAVAAPVRDENGDD